MKDGSGSIDIHELKAAMQVNLLLRPRPRPTVASSLSFRFEMGIVLIEVAGFRAEESYHLPDDKGHRQRRQWGAGL